MVKKAKKMNREQVEEVYAKVKEAHALLSSVDELIIERLQV